MWKKVWQTNGIRKQTDEAILTSHKTDFKLKFVRRNKRDNILISGTSDQENINLGPAGRLSR